jgi:hypothetical protein
MTRTEVTVGTEGFREYLEFSLGCSMDYREPPLKNGINDRSTIATNLHDLRVLRARISYLRLSTRVNSRSKAVPIRPVPALNTCVCVQTRHRTKGHYAIPSHFPNAHRPIQRCRFRSPCWKTKLATECLASPPQYHSEELRRFCIAQKRARRARRTPTGRSNLYPSRIPPLKLPR